MSHKIHCTTLSNGAYKDLFGSNRFEEKCRKLSGIIKIALKTAENYGGLCAALVLRDRDHPMQSKGPVCYRNTGLSFVMR
jgi:hypothetical protein